GLVALAGRDHGPNPQAQSGPAQGKPAARAENDAVDRYGDPLPRGAIARIGSTRFRHGSGFFRVAFAPDRQTVVPPLWDAPVCDAETGRLLRSFRAGTGMVMPSPDGRTLFAAGRGSVQAIDISTGRERYRCDFDPTSSPARLAISPDGKVLAA